MAINRAKWYIVTRRAKAGLFASTDIPGIRDRETVAPPEMIVPGEWFAHIKDDALRIVTFQPPEGHGAAVPYEPTRDEYLWLYTMYPAMTPSTRSITVNEAGPAGTRNKWYRVKWSFCGLQALADVVGIASAGDIVRNGEIVPAQFFGALDMQQFGRLVGWGMIEAYRPDPLELDDLLARFPGADPDFSDNVETEEG